MEMVMNVSGGWQAPVFAMLNPWVLPPVSELQNVRWLTVKIDAQYKTENGTRNKFTECVEN